MTLMVYPAVSKVSATVGAVFAGFLNMASVDLVGAAGKPVYSVRQGKVVGQLPHHLGCGITAPTPPELSTATEVLQTWSST